MPGGSPTRAGFIGLGAMGYPMASHLAQNGRLHAVFNRTRSRALDFLLEHPGVDVIEDPAELFDKVDLVFLCVPADQDVLGLVERLAKNISRGQTIVDSSTVSPKTARKAEALLQDHGAFFLDAPVSGGVEGAKSGCLSVMVGGPESEFLRLQPFFSSFSKQILHMGPVGAGQCTKAINQVMCAGINQAVTEALGFARDLGLNLEKTIEAIQSGAAGNWFLDKRGYSMVQGSFKPGFKLGLHQKDLDICLALARSVETEIPLTLMTREHYARLIFEGHADEDISALYRLKGKPCEK